MARCSCARLLESRSGVYRRLAVVGHRLHSWSSIRCVGRNWSIRHSSRYRSQGNTASARDVDFDLPLFLQRPSTNMIFPA